MVFNFPWLKDERYSFLAQFCDLLHLLCFYSNEKRVSVVSSQNDHFPMSLLSNCSLYGTPLKAPLPEKIQPYQSLAIPSSRTLNPNDSSSGRGNSMQAVSALTLNDLPKR